MPVSQNLEDHGKFTPMYEVKAHHDFMRDRTNIYVQKGVFASGCKLYEIRNPNPQFQEAPFMVVSPGEEAPLYLWVSSEVAQAIGEALAPRSPHGEAVDRHLNDTVTVRDRLLTMLEANTMMGMQETDRGVQHMIVESDLRRHPQVRVR